MSGAQRAAAALSVLNPADRRWLLDQLATTERRRVLAALQSLEGLPDNELMQLFELMPQIVASPQSSLEEEDRQLLAMTPADTMVSLISKLPLGCTAVLLEQQSWPWSETVMHGLNTRQRKELAACRLQTPRQVNERFTAWLIERLAERIRASEKPQRNDVEFEAQLTAMQR